MKVREQFCFSLSMNVAFDFCCLNKTSRPLSVYSAKEKRSKILCSISEWLKILCQLNSGHNNKYNAKEKVNTFKI